MIRRILHKVKEVLALPNELSALNEGIDKLKIHNGKLLALSLINKQSDCLSNIQAAEFQVFSQWGDDGIIQFLVNYLQIDKKIFIEFGVENYTEANTRFLLINNNWRGLIMDGSFENMSSVKRENLYWRYDLTALPVFITKENINNLILDNGFDGEIGLLSIDIDGNDYWVWKQINCVSPVIVIVEYNSVFGYKNPWTIPYIDNFYRTDYHYSNLCYGSSLLSLCDLAEEKGYYFIGCNSNGNNAYFVRKDKIKELRPLTAKEGYVESNFRESINEQKQLTFLSGKERLKKLNGVEIFNTRINKIEYIQAH